LGGGGGGWEQIDSSKMPMRLAWLHDKNPGVPWANFWNLNAGGLTYFIKRGKRVEGERQVEDWVPKRFHLVGPSRKRYLLKEKQSKEGPGKRRQTFGR